MNESLYRQAEVYAKQSYNVRTISEEMADGRRGYFAQVLELPGCVAQGFTQEEIEEEIKSAMSDYIYFLLRDGLTVPLPKPSNVFTVNVSHLAAFNQSGITFNDDTQWHDLRSSMDECRFVFQPA